jgi:hypothetical protein
LIISTEMKANSSLEDIPSQLKQVIDVMAAGLALNTDKDGADGDDPTDYFWYPSDNWIQEHMPAGYDIKTIASSKPICG